MSKWLRILVGLGIAVIACGVWFFGVQTFFIWETRSVARKEPVVSTRPVQLLDLSISQAPGKKLSYFGYVFEVPWDDIDQRADQDHRVQQGNHRVSLGERYFILEWPAERIDKQPRGRWQNRPEELKTAAWR